MPTFAQTQLIHVAKRQLQLPDDDYRSILSGLGVTSSKELTEAGVEQLMDIFKDLGFQPKLKTKTPFVERDGFASEKQLNKIKVMWHVSPKVRDHSMSALLNFIGNKFEVRSFDWITTPMVSKIIAAIEHL